MTAHKRRHTTQPFALCKLSYRVIVMADGEKIADGDVFRVLSDEAVLQRAHLKETSLCALARRAGLPPEAFVRHFIHYERMVRAGEQ